LKRALYPLLLAVPGAAIAWALNRQGASAGQLTIWVFALALIGLIPLASIIGEVTDRLADYLGPKTSGFISASFGNVPELAIGGFLLWHAGNVVARGGSPDNDFVIIRGLLIGSIINNVLLVLGISVLFGALRHGKLRFDKGEAAGYASMLALAVVGLSLPTLASAFAEKVGREEEVLKLNTTSIIVSGILIITYIMYVASEVFGFGSRPSKKVAEREAVALAAGAGHAEGHGEHGEHGEHHHGGSHHEKEEEAEERKREEEESKAREARHARRREHPSAAPLLLAALAIATIITVGLAGILVDVTENVIKGTFLTPFSTGFIIFPIVCNFGELVTAFMFAWRGNMRDAMEVAAGSSVQMPLFVTPVVVFLSVLFAFGNPDLVLTLIFKPLELIIVALATFVYALVNLDGETTWLEGLQLLAFFAMIAVTAFALPGA
jgi:Ca2+:H+ antiporter